MLIYSPKVVDTIGHNGDIGLEALRRFDDYAVCDNEVVPPQERLVPKSPEPGMRDLACGELTYTNIGSGVFVKASETLSTMAEAYLSKYLGEESPTESTTAAGSEHGSHCGGGVGSFHLVAAGSEAGAAPHASPVPMRVMPPAAAFCPDASSVEEELARAEAAAVATMGAIDGVRGPVPRVWAAQRHGPEITAVVERLRVEHRPLQPEVAAPLAMQLTECPWRAPARTPAPASARGGAGRSPAKSQTREGLASGHHESLSISLDEMEPVRPGAVGPLIRVGGGHIFIDQAWVAHDGRVFARDRAGTGLYELRQGRAGEAVVGVRVSKRP